MAHWYSTGLLCRKLQVQACSNLFLFLPPKDNSWTVKCNTPMCPLLHNFNKCPIETHDSASVKLSTIVETKTDNSDNFGRNK
jgi:hypothetical protein